MIWKILDAVFNAINAVFEFILSLAIPPPKFVKIPAPNNWHGVPEPDLDWEETFNKTDRIAPIIPMTIRVNPDTCPKCDEVLTPYKADKWDLGGGHFQYMIRGVYCKHGHYTHLECA